MESSIVGATVTPLSSYSHGVSGFDTSTRKSPVSCIPLSSFSIQDSRRFTSGGSSRKGRGFASRWRVAAQKERTGRVQAAEILEERQLEVPSCSCPLEEISHIRGHLGLSPHRATSGAVKWETVSGLGLLGWKALFGSALAWASTGSEVVGTQQIAGLLDDGTDFQNGFASAFLLIFFSEIGDKTFFIAALLAARKSAAPVFIGTFAALAAMTVISVALGRGFHYADEVLPFGFGQTQLPLDDLAAVILLVYFGVTTLVSAASMDDSGLDDEKQEAELAIASVGDSGLGAGALQAVAGTVAGTFALVFVAEWGDKSFFSTIALAAASDPLGVVSGAVAGHGVATLLAVLGGSFLSNYLSERVIAYTGGALFLVFAALTLVDISQRL